MWGQPFQRTFSSDMRDVCGELSSSPLPTSDSRGASSSIPIDTTEDEISSGSLNRKKEIPQVYN